MIDLTPQQVAAYDQAFAASTDMLANVIQAYRQGRTHDAADGIPEQMSVMHLAEILKFHWPHSTLVSALTVAIVLMAEHVDEETPA